METVKTLVSLLLILAMMALMWVLPGCSENPTIRRKMLEFRVREDCRVPVEGGVVLMPRGFVFRAWVIETEVADDEDLAYRD